VTDLTAGQIVLADWRGGALSPEPNKIRPAVVVDDDVLFGPDYPMVILVPITSEEGLVSPLLALTLDPTPENGCSRRCYALAPFVTAAAVARIRPTESMITRDQLAQLRRQIALSIGLA
jgi:mRNA interferase MazF